MNIIRLSILQLLGSLFDTGLERVEPDLLGRLDPSQVEWLRASGILTGPGAIAEVDCPACDQPDHREAVRFDSLSGRYKGHCIAGGSFSMRPGICEPAVFDVEEFLRTVGRALSIQRFRGDTLMNGQLVRLGTATLGSTAWEAFAVRGIGDQQTLAELLTLDRAGVGADRGLYLCFRRPAVPASATRHGFVEFDAALSWNGNEVEENAPAIRKELATGNRSQARLPSGDERTSEKITHDLLEEILHKKGRVPTGEDFLRSVRKRWPKDRTPPGRTQLFKHKQSFLAPARRASPEST